jgi:hypothetical protein
MFEQEEDIWQNLQEDIELEIEEQLVESSTELREVTGHCGGTGPLRNERRDIKSTVLGKKEVPVHL